MSIFRLDKLFNGKYSKHNDIIQSTTHINNHDSNDTTNSQLQVYHPNVLFGEAHMNWDQLRTYVAGLDNPGNNSCYINAAVQCLASTPPLVDWLFQQNKSVTCE